MPASPSTELTFDITLKVRDTCFCLHTQRAARALARRFDAAFRPLGLKSGQFSILMALNRPAPPKLGSVATLLAMDRTTLTANLKPLERRGLVESETDPADRRGRLLKLTPAGRALLQKALPLWERTQAGIEAGLADVAPGDLLASLAALSGT